ncbi:MAG: glycoside hydrolase [Clostridiales bacterium]|nr:glycoside hydrolase [Clostridiales bacterium]
MNRTMRLCAVLTLFIILFSGIPAKAADYRYNMSYIYFGNASGYTDYVQNAQNSLNEISPAYFSLNADGSLCINASIDRDFIKAMHDKGILVVPFLSNDWDRTKGIKALNGRNKLVKDIAAAILEYDLDGINIDIENVTPDERAAYVDLTRLLRETLSGEKLVTVAVAANPYNTDLGWQGSYDYAGLSSYCDYLMIMAYDEHYQSGPPGPVSSLSFIEKSILYALKYVSKEKIVLGLPFYGRIWSSSGGFPNGFGISNVRTEKLLSDYGGKVNFDLSSQSACATLTIKPSDVKPVIGGRSLNAGTYTIFYESERSLKAKLELVEKYDIKGTGSWSLGQETKKTWDYYKFWLNGCYFEDIANSWAKNTILEAYANKWIKGESAAAFNPEGQMTRAQAAVMLVRMLGLTPEKNDAWRFDDCTGRWEEPYISTARRYELVSGVGDNLYSPQSRITREEMAVMLNNILGYSASNSSRQYSDVTVSGNSWSISAICALSEKNILCGFPDGRFLPQNSLTRAEMTVLLSRLNGIMYVS